MEIPKENRMYYIIGGLIIIAFIVALMLKFWMYTVFALAGLAAGFYLGRKSRKPKGSGN